MINSKISVNYISQIFLIKNEWKDIRSLRKIWYVNNEMIHHYRIINIDYTVKNFKRTFRSEMMSFHAVNITEHDFILEISWLTAHNSIMNWDAKLWCYYLADDWIIIKELEVFMQSIQNEETVFWWDQISKAEEQNKSFMSQNDFHLKFIHNDLSWRSC